MRTSSIQAAVVFCVCLCTTSAIPSSSSSSSSSIFIPMAKPNCSQTCGNITVPYPFGMSARCCADSSFLVECLNSTNPPTLYLPRLDLQVTDIRVNGTIVVKYPVTPIKCTAVKKMESLGIKLLGSSFTISADENTFTVLGCRNSIFLQINGTGYSGCFPACGVDYTQDSCQIDIPPRSQELIYTYQSTTYTQPGNTTQYCGYAFPVERASLSKTYELYKGLRDDYFNPFDEQLTHAPLVLDWELTYIDTNEYARCSDYISNNRELRPNTLCVSPYYWGNLYHYTTKKCSCCYGFRGNPYLDGGCVDINECEEDPSRCAAPGVTCVNEIGSSTCHYQYSSHRVRNILLVTFGSLFVAGIFIPCLSKVILKRLKARRRRKFFVRNGGLLLEQKLSSIDNDYKKSKLFTSEELKQATNHYSENRVLGRGGQGTVYKGMPTDGSIVAVKKSKTVQETDVESFVNEVVILSQIIHRSIVRLLGCCLETETPILVYEFVPNGTLFEHIHDRSEDFPLTWQMRLRIVVEIASALSYLHSYASAPIFHRDIKSTNILLDEKYRVKVSDFGTSRSLAIDQTHFTTRVCGTYGYLDPEYFQSNQFTEKSDVYSFGVVMVELLTSEIVVSLLRAGTRRSLATHFLHSMEEGKLFEIVDPRIMEGGEREREEEITMVAELARRCLQLKGSLRPTMRQIANELESVIHIKRAEQSHDRDEVELSVTDFSSISPFAIASN
uniref:Cell wall-associated protein kinase 2 n=1 Tax=Craterostigma plantagineum TaxID=4153 RepID=A0A0S2ZYM0_CRAPL|nr:cell wall-associated protein kinase 2 [Craterostigma plantagineum]